MVTGPPPGWPWPKPTLPPRTPHESPVYEAWVRAHTEYVDLRKQWAGLAWTYGRYAQFTFRYADQRLPGGRFACRNCGKPASGRRRFYCGKSCDRDFYAAHIAPTQWKHWRRKAIQRDGGRCVLCGDGPMSPQDQRDEGKAEGAWQRMTHAEGSERDALAKHRASILERRADRNLEVDHIKPVARHPELEFTLSNLRTLCRRCHARTGARPPPRLTSKNRQLEVM